VPAPLDECGRWAADIGPFVPPTLDELTGRGETSSLSRAGLISRPVVEGGAGTCGRRTVDVCFLLLLAI
jgi:hypothetical protein